MILISLNIWDIRAVSETEVMLFLVAIVDS